MQCGVRIYCVQLQVDTVNCQHAKYSAEYGPIEPIAFAAHLSGDRLDSDSIANVIFQDARPAEAAVILGFPLPISLIAKPSDCMAAAHSCKAARCLGHVLVLGAAVSG